MPESGRQFRFVRPIAAGGFGTVYLAKEEHADGFSRIVAIKLLNAQWSDSDELNGRLRDEARLLGLLRHQNIVDVYDLTSLNGRSAVVMEYLEAVDCRFLMKHCTEIGQRLPVRVALEIVAAVAHALDAAFNRPPIKGDKPLRVIHRDIKPSNIMLDGHGLPKVLDFGVAQSEIASREANTQELQFGSVDYMAPERLFFEPETPASDVYSLAATLFELVAFERLGKAQGRASKHDAHLADRMSFLRGSIDTSAQVAAALEALLLSALHFEYEARPDAATFCQDARKLARSIEGMDMAVWSEQHVPDAVEASLARAEPGDALNDAVLLEDSVVRAREMDTAEMAVVRDIPDPVSNRESARAAALRRGALAELEQSSDIHIEPATGARADGAGKQMPDWTDGAGWNDRTMGNLTEAEGPPNRPGDPPESGAGGAGLSGDEDTANVPLMPGSVEDFEHSVTAVPAYDTVTGLAPVPPRSPVLFLVLGAVVPLTVALGFGALLVLQDWGGLRTRFLEWRTVSDPAQVVAPVTPMSKPDPAAVALAAGVETGGVRFVSRWPDTTKVRVRCKEASAKGGTEAWIDRDVASRCSVTAMRADRSRITAVVDAATAGEILCFVGGQTGCQPQ